MVTFKIGNTDYSPLVAKGGLKVDYEMLTADTSGRTADGNMHIDLVSNWLKHKVTVTFIPCTPTQVSQVIDAIYTAMTTSTKVTISYYDPRSNSLLAIDTYPGTPSITWNTLASGKQQTSTFSIPFIQM